MAAYAALVSLISNMEQISNHPRLSYCFHKRQIQSLEQKAGYLLELIEQGYNHGGLEAEEGLEREITRAAHAAEDVIESHVVDQIHSRTLRFINLQQVIRDLGAVAGKAMQLVKDKGVREEVEQPPPPHDVGESSSTTNTAMVGLDDELTQLLDSLTGHHSNRHVISIVGMGGTGKTTLALNLYMHQVVKEHFDIRGWATVSQQCNPQHILSQLLLSCQGKSTGGSVGELGEQLHKTLYGKRYLIVLDDIWGVEAWDKVRHYLPDGNDRSRVVITTRLSNVASLCGRECFDLSLLDEDRSWKLFCEKAVFFPHKDEDPLQLQLEDVAKKIVKSCKGLALSIVVIGGLLLNSPRTLVYWENILEGLETNDSKQKQEGLDVLSSSYNHLPPHLKPCFLYLGVFEEDSRIRASNITRLWVAEGFIKRKGTRVLEEIAADYIKDLSERNLVLGLERRFNGKIKYFSIHDLLRDLCIKVAEQQDFFHVRKLKESQGRTVRRLVGKPYKNETGVALARSILGENLSLECAKHKLLRVVDDTRNWYTKDVYGSNVNLRYLVRKQLSANVCLVWNLQTLILNNNYHVSHQLVVAPVGIWKMRQLRHVKCYKLYLPDPPPRRHGQDRHQMEHLQTLTGAVNLRLSEEVCEIAPKIKKLGLIYDAKKRGYDDGLMECLRNLDRFHKLESLILDITTYKEPSRDLVLSWQLALPRSLKKVSLRWCRLLWGDMSVMGSLPQLQVLQLEPLAVTGGMWSPITGQFLQLKILKIDCCGLSCWDADSSHFPVLEKLVLRDLWDLEDIPMEIGEIPTLGLIHVDFCSESAAISAVKIKKDQLENYDNDALEVVVCVTEVESMKRRLETEELDLNLFKLQIL